MKTNPPKVVACVPCWNAEQFIERTLLSLTSQTYPNLKILVSDDNSSDGTLEVCRNLADRDNRIVILEQSENLGWVENVNALLRHAQGELLFFAYHDDVYAKNYVERLVDALNANPDAVLAHGTIELTNVDGTIYECAYDNQVKSEGLYSRTKRLISREGHWWTPHHGLFRVQTGQKVGGLTRHRLGEYKADWPWVVQMALLGPFVHVSEVLVFKHYQEKSLSLSWNRGSEFELAVAAAVDKKVAEADIGFLVKTALRAHVSWQRLYYASRLTARLILRRKHGRGDLFSSSSGLK